MLKKIIKKIPEETSQIAQIVLAALILTLSDLEANKGTTASIPPIYPIIFLLEAKNIKMSGKIILVEKII